MARRTRSRPGFRRFPTAGVLSVVATLGAAGPAFGTPDPAVPSPEQGAAATTAAAARVAAIEAELAAARAAVEQAAQEAGRAAEAYNQARTLLEQRSKEAQEAGAAVERADQTAQAAAVALSQHAAEVFQGAGGVSRLDAFFGGSLRSVLDRAAGLEAVGEEQARVLRDAESARQLARVSQQAAGQARDRQAAAEGQARHAAAAAQARAEQVTSVAASLEQLQDRLVAELAALRHTSVQLERGRQAGLEARHEAENRRLFQARAAEPSLGGARPTPGAGSDAARLAALAAMGAVSPASRSAGVAAVLAFARARLGDPYVWGAAGPNTWDCSGLTMMAWRQAGVNLGHYTGTQWAQSKPVPLRQALPGDLVFYGTSTADIFHVGLYIGDGKMIHAPRTGDVVKVSSIFSTGNLLPYVGRPA